MKNTQFPFLLMDQNKNHQDDESDFSSQKNKKNKKKFELNQYEKFKPRPSISLENNNEYLEGAENQVKSMLSIFLKDIQKENHNIGVHHNKRNISKIGQKDLTIFKPKKKNRYSLALSEINDLNHNRHFLSGKDLQLNINRNNNGNNNQEEDSSIIANKNTKSNIENLNNIKIHNIKNKNNNKFMGSSLGVGKDSLNKKLKHKSSLTDSFIGSLLPMKRHNKNRPNDSLNDSSSFNLLINSNDVKNEDKNESKTLHQSNISKVRRNKNISSIIEDGKNIKNNLTKKIKRISKGEKDFHINDKSPGGSLNCQFNDSVIKESSSNFKPKDDKKKAKSNFNNTYQIHKKNTSDIKKINHMNKNKHPSIELNNSVKNTYQFKLSNSDDEKKNNKSNFLKNNNQFKSIRKLLRKSIIIRPEDIKINLKTNNKKNKKINTSLSIIKHKKTNNSFRSNKSSSSNKSKKTTKSITKSSSIKKLKNNKENNKLSFDILKRNEIKKKEKTSGNNITVLLSNEKKEKTKISENIKKGNESKNGPLITLPIKNNVHCPKYRILRRKAILYDSLNDEECEDAEEINHLFINPNSNFILIFDSLLTISVVISFMVIPFYLAKTLDFCRSLKIDSITIVNMSIEIIYIMDFLIGFCRGYYNWEEQLIYRKRRIIRHYLAHWFLLDLISAVPVFTLNKLHEPLCNDSLPSKYYNQILNIKRYLLISNRLLKIFKIFSENQAYKLLMNHINEYLNMIINICLIILALNYASCLYIFIARNSYPNWINHTHLDTSPFWQIYICSIYILMMAMTTVGYGDITCYSFSERIYQLLILIIGILAYSWAVTSFSNYIKKINEKSADFEHKKSILDEIKLTNQNLPDELYDKILRFLKFKNFNEKKLKSIIFDCLPISLKNNLICEMYKPIIKNFIFFKNFQNTDFIVRVILAFRPIIADKNDILINCNDLVEDIMFVKHGILSVELPLNSSNLQENIDKYINMTSYNPLQGNELEKSKDSTFLLTKINTNLSKKIQNSKFKSSTLGSFFSPKNNSNMRGSVSGFNSNIFASNFDSNLRLSTFGKKVANGEKVKDDIKYVRILCIRENEHFGDVMMFLEQRSPLRVRVKSKKAELFFLKKMDAIKISANYPNIWRRINKKSVFNFEQIKKSINKIVEIYCSVKKLNSIQEESSSNSSIYSELIRKGKIRKEETEIELRPKKFELINVPSNPRKSLSLKSSSTFSLKRILNKNNIEQINEIKVRKKRAYSTTKALFSNYNNKSNNKLSTRYQQINKIKKKSSLSPKIKIKRHNKKKVSFFLNSNNKNNIQYNRITTIKEEPNEGSLNQFKSTKSFKNSIKIEVSPKKRKKEKEIELTKIKKNIKNISFKSLQLNESSSMNLIKSENSDILERSIENSSNYYSYDNIINNEIKPNEEIKIHKEDNLFFRKATFSHHMKKYPTNSELESILESNRSKLKLLLKSFDNNNLNKKLSLNDSSSSDNSNFVKKKPFNSLISRTSLKLRWENTLSIYNNISFKYDSSYENCNKICGEKLIKNENNQQKLKNFLIEQILNAHPSGAKSFLSLSNKTMDIKLHTNQNKSKEKEKKDSFSSKTKNFKNCLSLKDDSTMMSNNFRKLPINHTASYNGNNFNFKMKKNSFNEGLFDSNHHLFRRKSYKPLNKKNISSKSNSLRTGLVLSSLEKNKKNSIKTPINKNKKRRDNILSKINLNIQKTNQNLNNPEEFYSNYFHSILGGESTSKNARNNNFYKISMKAFPKFKKERGGSLRRNFTLKK